MKVKLISCNFDGHRIMGIQNQAELEKFGVEFVNYDESNTPSRDKSLHPRLKGKIPKMLEWEKGGDYDYYIWMDSKFTLVDGVINQLITQLGDHDLALFNHPHRSTIKSEMDFMSGEMRFGNHYLNERYLGEDMQNQVNTYLADPTFIDDKLFACGCFVYSKRLVENKEYNLMKEWFYHNVIHSIQDQLSMPYLLHKFKTNYTTYNFDLLNTHLLKYNYT